MTTPSGIERVAQALLAARATGQLADAQALEGTLGSAEDAYAAQALVLAGMPDHVPGAPPGHWKSGGPSREAVLTHAPLPPAGVRANSADLGEFRFTERLVEAELALRLRQAVSPAQAGALTHADAAGLVDAMAVSVEIVDSRWLQGPKGAPALCKLADLQSHGALVLGSWVDFVPRDWDAQICMVQIGGHPATRWKGTHTLQDPAWLLPAWLRHATRHGDTVPAGTVVTTGSWCGMLPAQAGETLHVAFEGLGQVRVQL